MNLALVAQLDRASDF